MADASTSIIEALTPAPRRALRGVLVVEDDPDLQWRLARVLTIQGYRVVGTSSGDGALALIAEWPVDLALVAEDLPGMDGLQVTEAIRARNPDISVVLMGNDQNSDFEISARMAGAVACLAKPFRMETLTGLIDSMNLVAPAE